MSAITFEQFQRGIAAIDAYRDLVKRVYDAFLEAGEDRVDGLGGSGLVSELTRQLEERCNDPVDPGAGGSMIEYMLYEGRQHGGLCTSDDPPVSIEVNSVEALWAWWKATGEGPFTPPAETGAPLAAATEQRASASPALDDHTGSEPSGAGEL